MTKKRLVASTNLAELIESFRTRMPYPPPATLTSPDMLRTEQRIIEGQDLKRAALLDYLVFLVRHGAMLEPDEVVQALEVADFGPLSGAEVLRFAEARLDGLIGVGPEVQVRSVIPRPTNSPVYQLEKQIDELSTQVSELLSGGAVAAQPQLEKLQELVESIASSKGELSAPILLPTPDDMAVKLVSASSLDRLDEYHSDQNLFQTLFGVFAGAALGLVIGIVTAPELSITAWSGLTLVAFVTASGVFLVQAFRIRGRASKVRVAALGRKVRRVKRHDVAESGPTEEHVPDEG